MIMIILIVRLTILILLIIIVIIIIIIVILIRPVHLLRVSPLRVLESSFPGDLLSNSTDMRIPNP